MSGPLSLWVAEPPPREVRLALEWLAQHPDVARVAAMPDVHLAEEVCVGTVVATRSRLVPGAVGGDIGCGMAAVRFPIEAERLRDRLIAARALAGLGRRVPALRHAPGAGPALPQALRDRPLSAPALERLKAREALWELGTLGRGNHFIELQSDEAGALWLMLHSGSRALGQAVRDHHLRHARAESGLQVLEADSAEGQAYLADMAWALDYAQANRQALLAAASGAVADALGVAPEPETVITCHHNHVRQEQHFGEALWVHRKGAIPAEEGEPGIIPGSMGSASYHVAGRGEPEALRSSSHGAGRAMSRTEAHRRISARTLERELEGVWFDRRLAARLVDEAPSAYKDIGSVMRAQRELTRIVRKLRPLLSFKGA